uniref:Uncharacterized protein n=1 Tax=Apteryx owenii TaxID=8824 RepID=A0A8B9QG37_APTOW
EYAREDAMASWCRKCGQQVPRNPPFSGVRITEGEMKSYHDFIGRCIKLEHMANKDCYLRCQSLSPPLPSDMQPALLLLYNTEPCQRSPEMAVKVGKA